MALNNVFIGGGDPLLGSSSNSINADMEAYERRLQAVSYTHLTLPTT